MSWYNNEWKFRKKITVNKDELNINSNLYDFTLTLKLEKEYDILNYSKEDLSDLLVTDSNDNKIPHSVDYNDDQGNFVIRTNVPLITLGQNTELYIYYGNTTATNSEDITNTYKQYDVVSKMDMNREETNPDLDKGAGGLTRHGYQFNNTSQKEVEFDESPVGYGFMLHDGGAYEQYFSAPEQTCQGATSLSASAWVYKLESEDDVIYDQGYTHYMGSNGNFYASIRTNTTGSGKRLANGRAEKNVWTHVGYHWSATTNVLSLYINGVLSGTHIIPGDYIQEVDNNTFNIGGWINGEFIMKGAIADVRVSTSDTFTGDHIKTEYNNIMNSNLVTLETQEMSPSLLTVDTGWRIDYGDYEKRIEVPIKGSEISGTEDHRRFPFLLNLYDQCLNEASPYANDILITDEFGERLPFERFLYRQHINQTRFAGAYKVGLYGSARLVYDTNAEGGFRAGYLSGLTSYIDFEEVRVTELGIQDLNITYSNAFGSTKTVEVDVNGTIYTVLLPVTGSWSAYNTITIPVNFTEEWNSIKIGENTQCPDIDSIEVQGQDTAQLKGFVLLPKLKSQEDTVIHIYYKNPIAPIRFNPAYGQPVINVEAENFNLVSNTYILNNSIYNNGIGVATSANDGTMEYIFNHPSGFYDITSEILSDADSFDRFRIRINGVTINDFNTTPITSGASLTKIYNTKRFIYIENGSTISVVTTKGSSASYARIGSMSFAFSIFDTNPDWNSAEVWGDYEAVWHLNEIPGEGKTFNDYSGNERHLTSFNMDAGTNRVNNSIGAGVLFYDLNDVLYGQFDSMDLDEDDFTISMWAQQYSLTNNNRGLLISDNINIKIDNQDEFKFRMNDETKITNGDIATTEEFNYYSVTYDQSLSTKKISLNGNQLISDINSNNWSGDNNSLSLGRNYGEDILLGDNYETFKGVIAEVRIKKEMTSEDWQDNEYKNILEPQQYIDYDNMQYTVNSKHYVSVDASGGVVSNGNSKPKLELVRQSIAIVETSSNELEKTLEFMREMSGGVIVSNDTIETDFIITRISIMPVLTITTPETTDYTIEFIREHTGGVTSGGTIEVNDVNYVPDSTGSLSFGSVDTGHIIDNGFTLDVYFEDAIGGKGITGGAIINNVTRYTNIESGGLSWTSGTDAPRETIYKDNVANGNVVLTGDLDTNDHTAHYLDPSDNALGLLLANTEVGHIVDYFDSDYKVLVTTPGTSQDVQENIYIPHLEVSGISFTYGDVDFENHTSHYFDPSDNAKLLFTGSWTETNVITYIDDVANGVIDFTGDIDTNLHTSHYIDPSDTAMMILSPNTEVEHTVSYHPFHNQRISLSQSVNADWNNYEPDSTGSLSFGSIEASQEITDEWTLRITITDAFKGGVTLTNSDENNPIVEYKPTPEGSLKISEQETVSFVDYNGTYSDYILSINVIDTDEVVIYGDTTDTVTISIDVDHDRQLNYLPNVKVNRVLTNGYPPYEFGYFPKTNGVIKLDATVSMEIDYEIEIESAKITTTPIPENQQISYIPIPNGGITLSGGSLRDIDFDFIPTGKIKSSGISDFTIDFFSDNLLTVNLTFPTFVDEVIYEEPMRGTVLTSQNFTTPLVIDTTLVPTHWCIIGRVDVLDSIPLPSVSSLWDVYYVESNLVSNWYQLRPSGNFDPIANPLFNTGVLGVYNNVPDLPTTGNTVGDTWQIGPCHDGVYYVFTETGFEQDVVYPSVVNTTSIMSGGIYTSGSTDSELSFTTGIEVSGGINITIDFSMVSNYNSTSFPPKILTTGGHESKIGFTPLTSGGVTLTCDDTVPVLQRDIESVGGMTTDGSAKTKLEVTETTPIITGVLSGFTTETVVFTHKTSMTIISLSGNANPDEVLSYIDEPVLVSTSGESLTDDVTYSVELSGQNNLVVVSDNDIQAEYNYEADYAKAKIGVKFDSTVEFLIASAPLVIVSKEDMVVDIEYIVNESSSIYTTIPQQDFITEYVAIATGSAIWNKNISASTLVITNKLSASYFPSGKIIMSYYYLQPTVEYNVDSTEGSISLSGEENPSVHFTNVDVEYGSIDFNGNVEIEKITEFFQVSVTKITISDNTTHTVEYGSSNESADLKLISDTGLLVDYFSENSTEITLSGEIEYSIVDYENEVGYRSVSVTGETIVVVTRELEETNRLIQTSITTEHLVDYDTIHEGSLFTISSGVSSPNEVHVIKNIVAASLPKMSGGVSETAHYLSVSTVAAITGHGTDIEQIVYEPGCDFSKLRTRIDIPPETKHKWEIYRDASTEVQVYGELDYDLSGQVYNATLGGGVDMFTNQLEYEQEHNVTFYPYYRDGYIAKLSSEEVEYYNTREYVYESTQGGAITVHGNMLDPVEFYQTYTGLVTTYGTAVSRLRYGHDVAVETVIVSIGDSEVEYNEYNKYTNSSGVAKISFREFTPVEYEPVPTFDGNIDVYDIYLDGEVESEYFPIFDVRMYGRINLGGTSDVLVSYDHVSIIEPIEIVLSNNEHDYELSYEHESDVEVVLSSDDITVEQLETIYIPENSGVTWSRGTITDPTDIGVYLNEDIGGTIDTRGTADVIISKNFLTVVKLVHGGSIRIDGNTDYSPSINVPVEVETIIVIPVEVPNEVSFVYKTGTRRMKLSGTVETENSITGIVSGSIYVNGTSDSISEYIYTPAYYKVRIGGTVEVRIDIERESLCEVLVNGIYEGNIVVQPIVNGWLRFSGEMETADFVDYGELSVEVSSLIVSSETKYRTNVDTDLIFHEVTHRREYEAGIDDDEVTKEEDVWSTLQNFNDLLEGE